MDIKIFNTLNNKYNYLKSRYNKLLKMYSCGPTVYKYPHLGNLRTYITVDIVKKILYFFNFSIKHVMNITDVGHLENEERNHIKDKMNISAFILKSSPWNISRLYEKIFFDNCKLLNINKPNISCRATEYIYTMKNMINILKKKHMYMFIIKIFT